MKLSRKLGLIAFGISEAIICISAIFIFIDSYRTSPKSELLSMIIYAQLGVLGVVWGAQGLVNSAKQKYRIKELEEQQNE